MAKVSDLLQMTKEELERVRDGLVMRLVRLVDSPAEATCLAPLVTREVIYCLLMGKQGDRLRHVAVLGDFTAPTTLANEEWLA